MNCLYCDGRHLSDYCPGYNASSLRRTAKDISHGIEELWTNNQEALDQFSEQLEVARQSGDEMKESLEDAADQISSAISDGTESVTSGLRRVDSTLQDGFSNVAGAVLASGAMVYQGLVGIGTLISFREQMDQLRHEERERAEARRHQESLQFHEESSVAGSARRELRTAAVMMSVGDLNQAHHHVKRSLDLFPASAETFRLRSIIESRRGEHNAAIISLRAALKLAATGDLLPNIQNLNQTVANNAKHRIEVSGASQLALEMSIVGRETEALEILSSYVERFPSDSGLQVLRVRTLAKTPQWDALNEPRKSS